METPFTKIATRLGLAVVATVMGNAAGAQSNVTVSGWVHVALTHMNDGTSPFGGGAGRLDGWSVGNDDSALVVKGTEDLGGGMKARFLLDHRFNANDGTGRTGGTLTRPFWWQSTVAIDGPFGSIELGRQYTLFSKVAFFGDASGWMGVSQVPVFETPNLYPANDLVNINNAVTYTTPQFGPLQASIQAAPDEGPVPGREIGLRIEYASGPVYAGLALDRRNPPGASADRLAIFTGSYDFGVIKPIVSFARSRVGGQSDSNAYLVGGVIRLSELSTIHASWIVGHMPVAGFNGGAEVKKIGLQYRYLLSKRTMLFTSLGSSRQEQATRTTGYDFGIHHEF